MMKTLMSATALTALFAATSAFGQTQEPVAGSFTGNPPAAMEPAPGEAMEPVPGMEAQSMTPTPDATAPTLDLPPTQAVVPTLPPPEESARSFEQAEPVEMFIQQQGPGEVLASSLIGSTVENTAGEPLGDINDVVLTEDGSVDGIVIGVGGFLGIGEKDVAVSFESIEKSVDADGNVVLTLDTTAEALEGAPQYVTVAGLQQPPAAEKPAAPAPNQ